jgi:hypothetical protein
VSRCTRASTAGRGQGHRLGELQVGQASVRLQDIQDLQVDAVEIGSDGIHWLNFLS